MEELSYAAKLRAIAESAKPRAEEARRQHVDAFIAGEVKRCIGIVEGCADRGGFKSAYETYQVPSCIVSDYLSNEASPFHFTKIAARIREELIVKGLNTVAVTAKVPWYTFNIRCEW